MSEISIASSRGDYRVLIGTGLVPAALQTANVLLIDEYVHERVLSSDVASTIAVPGNEQTKTLSGCEMILMAMSAMGTKRGDLLVAVGGGAIQDAATLVASLYMRGIPWTYCPSTAMAMADSCIGGKSSINAGGIKNLVGNIYPPQQVVIDPALATDLPIAAKVSGLAEAVKICFAAGPESFGRYLALAEPPLNFGEGAATEALIFHVLTAKKWFIEVDEYDQRERQLLNFGHTFAHALESATNFALPHGVAVAVGVCAALDHPSSATSDSTEALRSYCVGLLKEVGELVSTACGSIDWALFDRAILTDKKGTRDEIRLVLPSRNGSLEIIGVDRSVESVDRIRESMVAALDGVAA